MSTPQLMSKARKPLVSATYGFEHRIGSFKVLQIKRNASRLWRRNDGWTGVRNIR